jgi:hypothetical protein
MKITRTQRRITLMTALLLTLAAAFGMSGEEAADARMVESLASKPAPSWEETRPSAAQAERVLNLALPQRQALHWGNKVMFASASWYVPPPPPKPEPPPPPSPPPLSFVFIGKMLAGDQLTVFLNWQNRSLTVKTGDKIDDIYRVDEIRPPQMTLTYLPLDMQQTLYIGELQ